MDDYLVTIKDSPLLLEVEISDRKTKRKKNLILSSYQEKLTEVKNEEEKGADYYA